MDPPPRPDRERPRRGRGDELLRGQADAPARGGALRRLRGQAAPAPIPPGPGQIRRDRRRRRRPGVLGTATTELVSPRAEGLREALRILLAARRSTDTQRTGARNALTALLRTPDLGIDARSPLTAAQITTVQGWRARQGDGAAAAVARPRHGASPPPSPSARNWKTTSGPWPSMSSSWPGSPGHPRGGPGDRGDHPRRVYSHHGRVRSEAAFAALVGAAPALGFRPHEQASTQPLRGPAIEPRTGRRRPDPKPHRPRHPCRHPAAHRERQDATGNPPLPL
jgi:hypothetical protein